MARKFDIECRKALRQVKQRWFVIGMFCWVMFTITGIVLAGMWVNYYMNYHYKLCDKEMTKYVQKEPVKYTYGHEDTVFCSKADWLSMDKTYSAYPNLVIVFGAIWRLVFTIAVMFGLGYLIHESIRIHNGD